MYINTQTRTLLTKESLATTGSLYTVSITTTLKPQHHKLNGWICYWPGSIRNIISGRIWRRNDQTVMKNIKRLNITTPDPRWECLQVNTALQWGQGWKKGNSQVSCKHSLLFLEKNNKQITSGWREHEWNVLNTCKTECGNLRDENRDVVRVVKPLQQRVVF